VSDDDTKGPVGQAVETIVYAPIGLFFEGPSLLPKLVEQGKNHARNARFLGKFAVQQGQVELRKRLAAFEEQAGDVLRAFGVTGDAVVDPPAPPASGPSSTSSGAASSASGPSDGSGGSGMSSGATGSASTAGSASTNGAAAEPSPRVQELAITDYDSLSASQVVTRLAGLAPDELEAVRAYEVAHRGRKTILNKIAQLQTS
jgi:hypothetical protein